MSVKEIDLLCEVGAIDEIEIKDEDGSGSYQLSLLLVGGIRRLVVDTSGTRPRVWRRLDNLLGTLGEKGVRLGPATLRAQVRK